MRLGSYNCTSISERFSAGYCGTNSIAPQQRIPALWGSWRLPGFSRRGNNWLRIVLSLNCVAFVSPLLWCQAYWQLHTRAWCSCWCCYEGKGGHRTPARRILNTDGLTLVVGSASCNPPFVVYTCGPWTARPKTSIWPCLYTPGLGVYKGKSDSFIFFFDHFNISSIFRYPRYIFNIESLTTTLFSQAWSVECLGRRSRFVLINAIDIYNEMSINFHF